MSDLSVGSPAYNEWVRVERDRLAISRLVSRGIIDRELAKETFDTLTKDNKKRRLLFSKGRKGDCARKPRMVRW